MDPALHIDRMDQALYEAVVEGNVEEYEALVQNVEQLGGRQVTPKGNTILHVAALHGHTQFVQNILEQQHSYAASLLCAPNKKNETALHIAAREGYTDIVSALIRYAKTCPEIESGIELTDILRMMDDDKDTALHKAVRKGHLGVVKLLVKEDPKFDFPANEAGETPIYLAAELQFHECLLEILNNCKRPVYNGPFGRTALHAAIINSEQSEPSDCTKLLLEKEASLCEAADDWGWTPLHYAVKQNAEKTVRDILRVNNSAAYVPAGKESKWTTAVHIAASRGSVAVLSEILKHCPDGWEMVNSKGQNVLHEAILNSRTKMVKFILNSPKRDHLIDEKDKDGNTPLHLLAACDIYVPELIKHPRLKNTVAFNKQHLTPLDIARYTSSDLRSDLRKACELCKRNGDRKACSIIQTGTKRKQKRRDREKRDINRGMTTAKTHIVVATLIATVTFAAGITLPGGFDDEGETQGMAILSSKAAFRAFVVTDAFGFVCSIASIIGYINLVEEAAYDDWSCKTILWIYSYAVLMLDLSLIGVVIAFITGLFAVLTSSTALAVEVCVCICLCAFGLISFPLFMGRMRHHILWFIECRLEKLIAVKRG